MTEEDKQLIAKYMGWQPYPPACVGDVLFYVDTTTYRPIRWDLNDAALCVQEMQKRGDWSYFYDDLLDTYNGLCEDCKEPCGADNFTAWLFNADNFFTAMAAWIKEEEK